MRGIAAFPAALLPAVLAAGCTTVVVAEPGIERSLAAALERRRVDAAAERVLRFREGVLEEAVDRGRIDRAERAAAAEHAVATLRAELSGIHRRRLDREGEVDLDLCSLLLDRAEEEIRLAALDDARIAALAWPAGEVAWMAAPGPPTREEAERMAAGRLPGDGPVPAGAAPPGGGESTPGDLGHAARRLRQAAGLLRKRGDEAAVLHPGPGEAARRHAREAADRAEEMAKALEEDAKREKEGGDGFAAPLGREAFASLLRTRHGVAEPPEAVAAWGRELLARVKEERDALAGAHWPGLGWREALERVRDDHPEPAAMPQEARAAAEAARDFCIERGLVTIPPEARLGHIEMVGEDMAKSYPFAAYGWRRAGPAGESGRYMVSPGANWMDEAQRRERLRGNCRAWTRVVAPHETWPGHHLQFWYADAHASPLRRESGTPVFVEGWGLYCEWLLDRHGFFATPDERLCLLVMRSWRACRVILDVALHCEGMDPEEAIAFLMENAGLTRDAAAAEVRRYMGQPTQPFSYAWGWREILRLRADEEARLGPEFDERAFHDRLLRCGPVPFPFVRRLFGYP